MLDVFDSPDNTLFFQIFGDKFVVVPNFQTFINRIRVITVIVDDVERFDAVTFRQFKVVLTVGRCDMNNPRARFVTDEIGSVDFVDFTVILVGRDCVFAYRIGI